MKSRIIWNRNKVPPQTRKTGPIIPSQTESAIYLTTGIMGSTTCERCFAS